MTSPDDQIRKIEEEIRTTPYHKATEHHIGRLRARLAQLKEERLTKGVQKAGSGGGFAVRKSGDATVVLVGPPSVGKSSLINAITRAQSKVAGYDFTTLTVIPGMLKYQGAKIQVFDLPGVIEGAAQGKGRGKEALSVVRAADLILIMVDVKTINQIDPVKNELSSLGIRLDEKPPAISIRKKTKGGLKITTTSPLTHLSLFTAKTIAAQFRFANAEIVIKENITPERLIDALLGNRVYLPYLVVVNKTDLVSSRRPRVAGAKPIYVSVVKKTGLATLKKAIWENLGLIRVYLKPKNKQADFEKPLIIKNGTSLRQLLDCLSLCTKDEVKRARVWGPGAKFEGQEVSFAFVPHDGTIVSFLG